ncbi:MAG: hypothetical protein OQJ91_10415 [Motiliproteus sp.]|nr:hypothetical protein [Motiliproteus sp.]
MRIDADNPYRGHDAMASVLLLYYQIVMYGGIYNDETVCIHPYRFNGFDFLDVDVDEGYADIDEKLLREGACIYLLCDLNDSISEYSDCYLSQGTTAKFIEVFKAGRMSAIPEIAELIETIGPTEADIDSDRYCQLLDQIYQRYVLNTFQELMQNSEPVD